MRKLPARDPLIHRVYLSRTPEIMEALSRILYDPRHPGYDSQRAANGSSAANPFLRELLFPFKLFSLDRPAEDLIALICDHGVVFLDRAVWRSFMKGCVLSGRTTQSSSESLKTRNLRSSRQYTSQCDSWCDVLVWSYTIGRPNVSQNTRTSRSCSRRQLERCGRRAR